MVCYGCACILGVILVCQMFKHPIINSLVCHEGRKYISNTPEIERAGDIGGAGDEEGGTGTKFFSPVSGNSQIITSRANNS